MSGVRPSHWIKLTAVLSATLLVILWYPTRPPKPLHQLTAEEWLADPRWPSIDLGDDGQVSAIMDFGTNAIPFLISAIHGRPKHKQRVKAMTALALLGRKHPQLVDPCFDRLLTTKDRWDAIPLLGLMGTRYFGALTNLLANPDAATSYYALQSLGHLGTNANVTPRLLLETESRRAPKQQEPALADPDVLARFGKLPESEIEQISGYLTNRHPKIRLFAVYILTHLPHNHAEVQAPLLGIANRHLGENPDTGETAALALPRVGAPADRAVPILLRRLGFAIDSYFAVKATFPRFYQGLPRDQYILAYLNALAEYGELARDTTDLVETDILWEAMSRCLTRRSARLALEIQAPLAKIREDWNLPAAYLSRASRIRSGDTPLLEWLDQSAHHEIDSSDAALIDFIVNFGPDAARFLKLEYLLNTDDDHRNTLIWTLPDRRVATARQPQFRKRILELLAILGREYPELTDPFLAHRVAPADIPWTAMLDARDLQAFTNASTVEQGLETLALRPPRPGYDPGDRIVKHFFEFLPEDKSFTHSTLLRLVAEPIREDDTLRERLIPYAKALTRQGAESSETQAVIQRRIWDPLVAVVLSPDSSLKQRVRASQHIYWSWPWMGGKEPPLTAKLRSRLLWVHPPPK